MEDYPRELGADMNTITVLAINIFSPCDLEIFTIDADILKKEYNDNLENFFNCEDPGTRAIDVEDLDSFLSKEYNYSQEYEVRELVDRIYITE